MTCPESPTISSAVFYNLPGFWLNIIGTPEKLVTSILTELPILFNEVGGHSIEPSIRRQQFKLLFIGWLPPCGSGLTLPILLQLDFKSIKICLYGFNRFFIFFLNATHLLDTDLFLPWKLKITIVIVIFLCILERNTANWHIWIIFTLFLPEWVITLSLILYVSLEGYLVDPG